jgi:MraZ protein
MFRGIHNLTLDVKGRLAIPTRHRGDLGGHSVLTIDPYALCLLLYPVAHWQPIEDNLQKLPSFDADARRIQRLLIGHATDLELDSNGRVVLPGMLREYANLDKNVVMIGQGNKFELWNENAWHTMSKQWLAETNRGQGLSEQMNTFSL